MSLRSYLIIMIIATALCWTGFIFVINNVNPEITNWLGFLLFYLSLFFSLVGSIAIIGFIIRFIFLKYELVINSVKTAFRQSVLFSLFIIIILFLLAKNLFSWLNVVLLIIGLSVLEFFLLSYNKQEEISDNNQESEL